MESTGSPSPDHPLRRRPSPRETPRTRPVRPIPNARSLRLQRSILSLGSFSPCFACSFLPCLISTVPPEELPGGLRHSPDCAESQRYAAKTVWSKVRGGPDRCRASEGCVLNSSITKDTKSHKGMNPRGFPCAPLSPSLTGHYRIERSLKSASIARASPFQFQIETYQACRHDYSNFEEVFFRFKLAVR